MLNYLIECFDRVGIEERKAPKVDWGGEREKMLFPHTFLLRSDLWKLHFIQPAPLQAARTQLPVYKMGITWLFTIPAKSLSNRGEGEERGGARE